MGIPVVNVRPGTVMQDGSVAGAYSKTLNYYSDMIGAFSGENLRDKNRMISESMIQMFNRTCEMFEYENLPFDKDDFELLLQVNGYVAVIKDGDELVATRCSWGPGRDKYYKPTNVIISNPYLDNDIILKERFIGKDCVLIKCDPMIQGLRTSIGKYATLICEAEISLLNALINTRMMNTMIANTSDQKTACDSYMKDLESGNLASILDKSSIVSAIRIQEGSTNNNLITTLTQTIQYLSGKIFCDLGLKGNYNMKSENVSETESKIGDDTLKPLIDSMLECRQKGIDEVNELFGTSIKVGLSSVWKDRQIETDAILENLQLSDPAFDTEDLMNEGGVVEEPETEVVEEPETEVVEKPETEVVEEPETEVVEEPETEPETEVVEDPETETQKVEVEVKVVVIAADEESGVDVENIEVDEIEKDGEEDDE